MAGSDSAVFHLMDPIAGFGDHRIMRGQKQSFAASLTTNGFLLTRKLLAELEDAGLQVMQISVDRMTPSPITKKSFKTILPKLDYFENSKISLHITGVICADTLPNRGPCSRLACRGEFPPRFAWCTRTH